jgi:protein arginine kinase activator
MLCDRCKINEAKYRFRQIINGVVTEMWLCPACAEEGGDDLEIYGVGALLPSIFVLPLTIAKTKHRVCPDCGTSIEEFKETAWLGCQTCYTEFKDILEPMIKRLHGSTTHVGKIPTKPNKLKSANKTQERARLVKLMERAIENEEFEEAATLRDTIRAMDLGGGAKQ